MRKLLLSLLLCTSLALSAQTADERAGTFMNRESWFDLQREMAANKDSLHPFLRDFGQALLDNFFNRPEAACASIGHLLNERQDEMGFDNTASMLYMMANNLSKLGENSKAADALKDFCDQLEGKVDATFLTTYRRKEQELRALAKYDLYQWNRPDGDLMLPFNVDSIGKKGSTAITLEGALNGKEQRFTLDTGAGVNVVTPEVAEACGMKMLDVAITAHGIRTGSGHLAIAEELKMGDLYMRNVPFYVLDMKTGEEKADRYMKHLEAIIGLPLLSQLQEVQLNFKSNRLVIPQTLTPAPAFAPNICFNGKEILDIEVIYDHELLQMNFDSGSGVSQLNYPYYEKHKDRIERIAERDSVGMGGFGGTTRMAIYSLPGGCMQIGEYSGCVDTLMVVATPTDGSVHLSGDGMVGMDIFRSFSTVTINLKDMFVKTTPRLQGVNATNFDSRKLNLKLQEENLKFTDILLGITDLYLHWKMDMR